MKYTYTLSNGKELKLRLTTGEEIEIERSTNKPILSYLKEESITMMCTLLRYLVKEIDGVEQKNFSFKNAQELFDEMIDSGLTIKQVLMDVIYESLVVSGFLEKEEWEEMKTAWTQASKKSKTEAV